MVTRDPAGGLVWRPCPRGESPLVDGGRYLITGASGALGRALARHLADRYRARLLLTGRRPLDGDIDALLADLIRRGAEARYVAADLAEPAGAAAVERAVGEAWDGLDGLFHLAGGLDPAALRAKREGLVQLRSLEPGLTVLFSSISAVLPGLDRGIEDYAAANAWLDSYAERAQREGRRVVSIAWPPWEGGGLAADSADALRERGIAPIEPRRAMAALEWALGSGEPRIVVLRREAVAADAPALPGDLREQVRALLAAAAERTPEDIGDTDRLVELGIDSLEAMSLVQELERRIGRSLPTTLLYEFDTLDGVVGAIEAGTVREETDEADAGGGGGGEEGWAVPLLPSQQTFVVQREFFPDIPGNVLLACTVARAGDTGPALRREALDEALELLVRRHRPLGAVIRREGGKYRLVDGREPPEVSWEDTLDEHAIANAPFDLERGPLLRVHTDGRRLILNAHHAAVDAWSLKIVLEELLACHEARLASEEPGLPALEGDWATAAAALERAGGSGLRYWRERFADGVPPLPLPWDGPADEPASGPCDAHHTHLDPDDTSALEARARALGVSLPALVLATYQRCLWDWSGQHDVTVRVAHGRREVRVADAGELVGSFADSLPVRVRLEHGEPLADLARRTHEELGQARAHAAASSMALAGLAGRESGAGPTGLTPAGFSFPLLPAPARVGGLSLDGIRGASASGFTRIGLIAWVFDGRLHLSWNHVYSHLRPSTVRRLADEHLELIRQVARGEEPASPPELLHRRVLEQCRRHPERRAVEGFTYGDLARRSAALATRLDGVGDGGEGGGRVAVLAPPGGEAVAILLAVLRTGAAYVPLEPSWPDRRVAQVLVRGRPRALVTTTALADRARALAGEIPVVVLGPQEADDGPARRGSLAYVMFTSGSTGEPKGVMVSHRAVLAFHDWVARVLGVTGDDRFVQTSSLAFGGSIRQIWSPLLAGATIHPVSREVVRDPDALVRFIRDEGITIWNSVPSLWMHLLDAVDRCGGEPLAGVRWVLLGGEAVPAAHVRRWRERFGDAHRLANLYGSTESIVNASWYEVTRAPGSDQVHTPIGWVRAGQRVHLLDEVDGVGEIGVSGQVADGYLDQPDLTAATFVERPGIGRVYRTGDLARRAEDGALVYLGRRDSQVQVRGNRVELGEIEATLCNHPSVEHAMVTHDGERLRATVQRRPGEADLGGDGLRAWLAERLPDWMLPHRFEVVDQLPRTAVGKADRRGAVPAAAEAPRATGEGDDPIQERVARAWVEVLDLDEVPGPDDDFFSLGGDSLLALVVLEKLRGELAPVPRPIVLYRHRRLGDLCEALRVAGAAPLAEAAIDASQGAGGAPGPAAPAGDLPLSPVQRGFWIAHKLNPEHPPTWCASVPVHGVLDAGAFERAVDWIVARHPLLRTVFVESFSGPVQRIADPPPSMVLQRDDLSALPFAARGRALEARWEEEAVARHDLERGPLFRVRLCRVADGEHRLILGAHHIAADAWSAWLLAGEVIRAHDAFARGDVPSLPPPAGSYFDDATRPERDDPYWRGALADLTQEPAAPRDESVEDELVLSPGDWSRLTRAARRRASSPYLLVLTALARALGELTGQRDLVVATALSGRDGREETVGRVVGPYAVALPVRIRGEATVARVAEAFGDACAHADASPARIAAAAGPDAARRLGRFFLSWLDPAAVPLPADAGLHIDWAGGRYRFATQATDTEVMVGALVGEGLHLNLHGGALVHRLVPVLRRHLLAMAGADAALVVYAPDDLTLPVDRPLVVERIEAALGTSELVLLPARAGELASLADLDQRVAEAAACTDAPVVSLAGMLPSLTGLGARPLAGRDRCLTTGHAATVVAMVRTLQLALERTGARWSDLAVGLLGYGSIGRAVLALASHVLGEPRGVILRDPSLPDSAPDLSGADWILGATSGGRALDVGSLAPGTVVIDDSFPRAFDDREAIARMEGQGDVLLVGGGMLDAGELRRESPFPQADALRERFGARWLPGCHAEALLIAARPELGPTVGPVELPRALSVWDAAAAAGLRAPPLHLGAWEVPDAVVTALADRTRSRG